MNKKIREFTIVKNDTWNIGRYTIVSVENDKGLKGIGIARKSQLDKRDNRELALSIAKGRAMRALALKEKNKLLRHSLMG